MQDRPSIALVIPTHNRREKLARAVSSALLQTSPFDEIIVVDDASDSPVSYQELPSIQHPPHLNIIRNERNVGAGRSRVTGLRSSKCEIVAFLDSDDALHPEYVENILKIWGVADKNTAAVAVAFFWCTDDLTPYRVQVSPKVEFLTLLQKGNYVGGCSIISVRRDLASKIEFPTTRGAEDWGYLLRIAKCYRIHTDHRPLVYYTSPSASSSDNMTKNYRRQILSVKRILREHCDPTKAVARKQRRTLAALHLARAGRKRLARRLIFGGLVQGEMRIQDTLKACAALILGGETYSKILQKRTQIRAEKSKLGRAPEFELT